MTEFAEMFDMIGTLWVIFAGMVLVLWAAEQILAQILGE